MTSTRTQSGPISPLALLHELADNWWLVLLRGIAAIAFGILAFFWPGIALVTLVFLWGAYAIVFGPGGSDCRYRRRSRAALVARTGRHCRYSGRGACFRLAR